jgi:AcrR family transcriptional regulator
MSITMSAATLSERLADHTRSLILAAAIEHLHESSVTDLTVRALAARAGISERTVFRYFATRDQLLDAVAADIAGHLDLPPSPKTIDDVLAFPERLYRRFEAKPTLSRAALHPDLVARMRSSHWRQRWMAVQALIDTHAPQHGETERKIAATNIAYFLSASTWHYYRHQFGFSLRDTIACARTAVQQAMEGVGIRTGA